MGEWDSPGCGEARVPENAILSFLDKLKAEGCLLHGFAMLDRGKLLAEGYWAPFHKDALHRMYSVGKSFVSLAIGLLWEEGKLALDDPICRYFPEKCPKEGPHPWLAQLTIRQILTMTTCHSRTTYKQYDGDWVESFFRVAPSNLPGAVFSYDTSATHVLSALAERLSGRKLMEYLREKCLDQIGVSKEAYFIPDPSGVSQGGSGLMCTLRDVLSVAELVMNEGVFRGRELVPAEYIREAAACQVKTSHQQAYDEQFGYGYQIWRGRHHSFYFYGIGGQLAVCLPREQFILVTMGNTLENKNGIKDIFDAFYDIIYPWIGYEVWDVPVLNGEKGKAVRRDCGELAARVAGLSLAQYSQGASAGETAFEGRKTEETVSEGAETKGNASEGAETKGNASEGAESGGQTFNATEFRSSISEGAESKSEYQEAFWRGEFAWIGRKYSFDDNKLKISGLCVTCDGEGRRGCLSLEKGGRSSRLFFGMDTYVQQKFPWTEAWRPWERGYCSDAECCCQGILDSADMLLLRCYILGPEMANLVIVLQFQEHGVTVKMQKGIENGLQHFEGAASGMSVLNT